jgi:hypothetical protein
LNKQRQTGSQIKIYKWYFRMDIHLMTKEGLPLTS